jgi:hypothetical protein
VIVHPDPETPLQHVIDAYDATRLAGFNQVQFAVATAIEAPASISTSARALPQKAFSRAPR